MTADKDAKWITIQTDENQSLVQLFGAWRLSNLKQIGQSLANLKTLSSRNIIISGSSLESLDAAGSMLLLETFQTQDIENIRLENFSEAEAKLFSLVAEQYKEQKNKVPVKPPAMLERLGRSGVTTWHKLKGVATFLGFTAVEFMKIFFNPRLLRVKELTTQLEHTFINAIPITCLLTFLIGIVIAYLSAIQIEKFGANIFIVDAVTITMCRELSPILVAVLVAGRSGSAFTAQIGAMKINEELDAITSLGLSTFRVLVLPRILALIIAMPMLVFIGDALGILGGMFIADLRLSITGATFIDRIQAVLPLRSFLVGLIKAPFFALFIALIGCREGLEVEKNARSLGLSTTSTVVQSIVAVILLNAAFAVIFVELGI